jgi:AcrR family transcriptional regulator
VAQKRVTDRRIQRTQRQLRDALRSLIGEKDYDAITVQEILDRADVGRSTFYMHFPDKDALLTSGIQEMLGSVHASGSLASARLREPFTWFSLPILEFIEKHRRHEPASAARMGTRGRVVIHEHLRKVLTVLIVEDVGRGHRGGTMGANHIPPELLVQHVASTFILVLNWWVESRSPLAPKAVNEVFRALILPTLKSQ